MSKLKMVLYACLGSLVSVSIWSFMGGCHSPSKQETAVPPPAEESPITEEEYSPPAEESRRELIEEGVIREEEAPERVSGSAPPVPPAEVSHVVEKGDTLWAISRQYGVTVNEIQEANGISDPGVIRPGQRLIIPAGGEE